MNAHNLPLRIPSAEAEPAGLRHDRSSGPAGAHGEFVGQLRAAAGVPRHTGRRPAATARWAVLVSESLEIFLNWAWYANYWRIRMRGTSHAPLHQSACCTVRKARYGKVQQVGTTTKPLFGHPGLVDIKSLLGNFLMEPMVYYGKAKE